MEYVVIAIDGQTNVSWGDGQRFEKETAEREAARRNMVADRDGTDWCYMTLPADQWEDGRKEELLHKLREDRDFAAKHSDHAEALILNDRVRALKEGGSVTVESITQNFESALARKRFYGPHSKN